MTLEKLSVFIITKNEEDRIGAVIEAVKEVADEILVIDSGSSDKTCETAMKHGAKVMFNAWQGYGAQKIFGENQCRNKWILNIDADEEVSNELSDEIKKLFSNKDYENFYGFRIKIVNRFRFEKKPKKCAYYYNQLRLYNKDFAGFKNSTVHDSVELKEKNEQKIGQLKEIIYHQSFRSFEHWIDKINSYSSAQAEDAVSKGKSVSMIKILLVPSFAFLKAYFVRRYFIYGFDGFIYSYLFAFSRFAKMIKIRESNRAKKE
ncbi:MAG: glycosyltransferase family 2 protein [Rickettsiales bacterium]|nr:glycosyltransferase family 2 protein [Rickettsiales bacterium]